MEHYTKFTMADRCLFQNYLSGGLKIREIAFRMKKHASTLYRELARNNDNGVYLPSVAHKKALARCRRPSTIELNPTLKSYIHQHLRLGWSPEQIAGRLKRKKSKYAICHETIYRYIYKKKTSSLIYLLTRKNRSVSVTWLEKK